MKREMIQSEEYIAKELKNLGWKYVEQSRLIVDPSQPIAVEHLKTSLKRINPEISDKEVEEVIKTLEYTPVSYEGAKKILRYIKYGLPIEDPKTKLPKEIKLIDYDNPDKNSFLYSRQVRYGIVPDIVLYINGLPIMLIECKAINVGWKEAYKQVKRYEKEFPELFKYVQLSLAVADKIVYFPNVPWSEEVSVYEWKPNPIEFLEKEKILNILKYFTFYREKDGKITKVLPRYMQYRAVNSIVNRAVRYARGESERNKGLIWHWQGSGKTLTMIFSAYKIQDLLGNPTIFFIVDRRELQTQLKEELRALKIGFKVVRSIPHLKRILTHADGERGIFIALIQKFREEEFRELISMIKEIGKKKLSIMDRKDVVVLIDEGHRTQYGDLAAVMRTVLKKASFFAFTGTPIAKVGRDTYATFGYEDEPYLDRYFIIDSIKDGYTVKIAYQARLDLEHLDRDSLEVFLSSKLEEIPEEYREKVEEDLKKKLNAIKVVLKNPKRIERVARDIAMHYKKHVEPFKAMVVAVDREACVLYKEALDKFLPEDYSEIVMTFNQNDTEKIRKYFEILREKYKTKEQKDIREEIIRRFKKENEKPKILIVTDMLLTGFDAPILQTMYLDKPLKEHRLLQAIARTNRPYIKDGENVKGAGLVIDYIGIFKELKKALSIYDEADIRGVAYNIEEIKEELKKKINEIMKIFDGIPRNLDRETIDKAINRIEELDKGNLFKKLYREIRNLYRLLIEERIEFKQDFDWLTEVYYAYYRKVEGIDSVEIEQKRDQFFKEALRFIHETIDVEKIRKDFPIVELDEEFLKKVMKKEKARSFYDLLFAVNRYIKRGEALITEDIVERVEKIIKNWREREKNVEELYDELLSVAKTINERRKEMERLKLTPLEYSLILALRNHMRASTEELIEIAKEIIKNTEKDRFEGWKEKSDVIKNISKNILFFLIKYRERLDNIQKTRDDIVESLMKWG